MRDPIAEHSVLGAVMVNPDIAGPALLDLETIEFTNGRERVCAELLVDMLRKAGPIDPIIVATEAANRGYDLPASWIFDVQKTAFDPRSAHAYAARVRDCYRVRRLTDESMGMRDAMLRMADTGQAEDFDTILDSARASLEQIPDPLGHSTATPPPTLRELLAMKPTYDWLVPHLLERGERLMLTGEEGLGKSYLLRQLAACLAAGVHPFTGGRFGDGLRVLHVDAENGVSQSRRAYARITDAVEGHHPDQGWQDNLMIIPRPDGLDLVGEDRVWWERTCAAAAPDVIITGPVYRLAAGNPNAEEDVRALVQSLDKVRVRHNAALILEAHAGHGTPGGVRAMRPAGASLWRRWPENGLGLVRSKDDPQGKRAVYVDMTPWRMAREERAWPDQIAHGSRRLRQLPWVPLRGDYTGLVGEIGREESA